MKYLGDETKGQLCKDYLLSGKKKNVVLGFGANACKLLGVTSVYCYFMERKIYNIVSNGVYLELKAKLKKDPKFNKKAQNKKKSLDENLKLILNVCSLPDTAFFPIMFYLMSD